MPRSTSPFVSRTLLACLAAAGVSACQDDPVTVPAGGEAVAAPRLLSAVRQSQPFLRPARPSDLTGRTTHGGSGGLDDITSKPGPFRHMMWTLDRIENTVVAGDGIEMDDYPFGFYWEVAVDDPESMWSWPPTSDGGSSLNWGYGTGPGPNEAWAPDWKLWWIINYAAGSCSDPSAVGIDYSNRVDGTTGEFEASDTTTLTGTGFWIFEYTIRADDEAGNVSDFHFEGTVRIYCGGPS